MALVAVQRLDRGPLADRRRAGDALRLQHVHGIDQHFRSRAIADAPAGHAIGLGKPVQGQGTAEKLRLHGGKRREFDTIIADVFVDIVRQGPDLRMFQQHIRQPAQFVRRIGRAGRVARAVQHQPFGLWRDGGFELFRRHLEISLCGTFDKNRHAAVQPGQVRIGHPVGRGHDDLVAVIHRGGEGVEDDLLATGANGNLLGRVIQPVFAL